MKPSISRRAPIMQRRRVVAAWVAVTLLAAAPAGAEPPVRRPAGSRPGTIVDPAVVPAGGQPCRHCGAAGCPLHRGHLAECRDGLCAPHCPVRPSQYGFYHTQWRRWPGRGVTPVGAEQEATPAAPPRSLVPSADEESPLPPAVESKEAAESAPAAADAPAASEPNDPVAPVPPGEQPFPPQPEPAGKLPDQSVIPDADAGTVVEAGALRYPATVGNSLAAGAVPWRLQPTARQRPAESARGL